MWEWLCHHLPVRLAAGSVLSSVIFITEIFRTQREIPKQNHYNLRFHLTEEGITNEKAVSSTYSSILLHREYRAQNVNPTGGSVPLLVDVLPYRWIYSPTGGCVPLQVDVFLINLGGSIVIVEPNPIVV